MYIRAGPRSRSTEQLQPILGSELRNELGKRPFAALLTPERQGVDGQYPQRRSNRVARQYGVEIVDVRIKRADLPDGTPLAVGVRADAHRAPAGSPLDPRRRARKQAQIIRAEADAEAAQTYAASFGKDPEFYDFYRAMQSYQTTFLGDGQDEARPDHHHLVAAERLFEGIHWTRALNSVQIGVH